MVHGRRKYIANVSRKIGVSAACLTAGLRMRLTYCDISRGSAVVVAKVDHLFLWLLSLELARLQSSRQQLPRHLRHPRMCSPSSSSLPSLQHLSSDWCTSFREHPGKVVPEDYKAVRL